jgi:hypothetical protein
VFDLPFRPGRCRLARRREGRGQVPLENLFISFYRIWLVFFFLAKRIWLVFFFEIKRIWLVKWVGSRMLAGLCHSLWLACWSALLCPSFLPFRPSVRASAIPILHPGSSVRRAAHPWVGIGQAHLACIGRSQCLLLRVWGYEFTDAGDEGGATKPPPTRLAAVEAVEQVLDLRV